MGVGFARLEAGDQTRLWDLTAAGQAVFEPASASPSSDAKLGAIEQRW